MDRSNIQSELFKALQIHDNQGSYSLETTPEEDRLLLVSRTGTLNELKDLLGISSMLQTAFEYKERPSFLGNKEICNISLMLYLSVYGGVAPIVEYLLALAQTHERRLRVLSYEDLIDRTIVLAAIDSESIEVFQKLVDAKPHCVNQDLGKYSGHPLNRVIGRSTSIYESKISPEVEIEFVTFLLENGADPNAKGLAAREPGIQLKTACAYAPLKVVDLLLQHGALVPQSGAFQAAVIADRTDCLDLLLESGANVDELLSLPFVDGYDTEKQREESSQTPLHFAVEHKARNSVIWLLEHNADTTLRNFYGKTPVDLARESGSQEIMDLFEAL